MQPNCLDQWFSPEQQRFYVSKLLGRVGLTRRRAECFVRLWAYLLLKQQILEKQLNQPLVQLIPMQMPVACTHREAAELFYVNQERGSDRAAGMMINRLAALGLVEKQFDGHTLSLQIKNFSGFDSQAEPSSSAQLNLDTFSPRTDAVPITGLVRQGFSLETAAATQKIARALREWSHLYPQGLRVLRRSDNLVPVGICILLPIAQESEQNFFLPPSKSLYLTSSAKEDPIKIAQVGDLSCTSAFIRLWMIAPEYWHKTHICQLVEDGQKILRQMQIEFPNLCDLYVFTSSPAYELQLALGFQNVYPDPQKQLCWMYQSIDQFLGLNIPEIMAR